MRNKIIAIAFVVAHIVSFIVLLTIPTTATVGPPDDVWRSYSILHEQNEFLRAEINLLMRDKAALQEQSLADRDHIEALQLQNRADRERLETERRYHWKETELLNQEIRKVRQQNHDTSKSIGTVSDPSTQPKTVFETNSESATSIRTLAGPSVQPPRRNEQQLPPYDGIEPGMPIGTLSWASVQTPLHHGQCASVPHSPIQPPPSVHTPTVVARFSFPEEAVPVSFRTFQF